MKKIFLSVIILPKSKIRSHLFEDNFASQKNWVHLCGTVSSIANWYYYIYSDSCMTDTKLEIVIKFLGTSVN